MKNLRALIQTAEYREAYERVSSKCRNQISRKALELMSDPTPGGSRTTLKGYNQLCRLRAGDFRIIYAYNDQVVQLMNLRRRDEHTYDNLEESEIRQFAGFRVIAGEELSQRMIPDWKAVAEKWSPPKVKDVERLPQKITTTMLEELRVPEEFRPALLNVNSVDDLLDCQGAPPDCIELLLDCIFPKGNDITAKQSTPVIVLGDLIDHRAAEAGGPIDASDSKELLQTDVHSRRPITHAGGRKKYGVPDGDFFSLPLIVLSTRKLVPMKPYQGNTSKSIGKDARYTVKLNGKVALLYYVGDKETALLTTDDHPDLVKLVNEAK